MSIHLHTLPSAVIEHSKTDTNEMASVAATECGVGEYYGATNHVCILQTET
jgi:hypothetical protein